MSETIQKHLPEICGAVIGLLLAFCFLGLGFFKTIFVIVMSVVGLVIGHYWPLLRSFINSKQ